MHRRAFLGSAAASFAFVPALPQVPYASLGAMDSGPPPPAGGLSPEVFAAWLADFRVRAAAAGLPPDFLALELAGLAPDPTAVAQDARQPEFSKPVSAYLAVAVSDGQVSAGRAHRQGGLARPPGPALRRAGRRAGGDLGHGVRLRPAAGRP